MTLASRLMGEDVVFGPSPEVEARPDGQESEAGGGQLGAVFARQTALELGLQGVKVEDIGRSVGELGPAQGLRRPVRALLLLGQLDVEEILDQVLEAVPVGIRTRQPRGDL